jgi:hypothetical protein
MAVTARQHLVNLYTDELAVNIAHKYATHCTAGKREVEAADKAAHEEYQELITLFTMALDRITDPLEERIESLKWECMEASMGEDF